MAEIKGVLVGALAGCVQMAKRLGWERDEFLYVPYPAALLGAVIPADAKVVWGDADYLTVEEVEKTGKLIAQAMVRWRTQQREREAGVHRLVTDPPVGSRVEMPKAGLAPVPELSERMAAALIPNHLVESVQVADVWDSSEYSPEDPPDDSPEDAPDPLADLRQAQELINRVAATLLKPEPSGLIPLMKHPQWRGLLDAAQAEARLLYDRTTVRPHEQPKRGEG